MSTGGSWPDESWLGEDPSSDLALTSLLLRCSSSSSSSSCDISDSLFNVFPLVQNYQRGYWDLVTVHSTFKSFLFSYSFLVTENNMSALSLVLTGFTIFPVPDILFMLFSETNLYCSKKGSWEDYYPFFPYFYVSDVRKRILSAFLH